MNEKAKLQLQRTPRPAIKSTKSEQTVSPKVNPPDAVLSMQSALGNQAFQRQLRGGLPPSLIPGAGSGLGNHAIQRMIQTKLTVGPPGDSYEREADKVADQVMQAPARSVGQTAQRESAEEEEVQTKPLAGSISRMVQRAGSEEEEVQTKPVAGSAASLVQRASPEEEELQTKPIEGTSAAAIQRAAEEQEEEGEELQTKPAIQRASAEGGFTASDGLEDRLVSQKGGGSPLSGEIRAFMEPRFGADFGAVKVHQGSEAAQMNQEIQAQAFTLGHDIYMGEGKFNPGSADGKRLLAHELTHVVQQTGAGSAQPKRDADS